MISHIGYLGVTIEVIWNYQPLFFVIMRFYNLYSNYVCISSILNTHLEKPISIFIISTGCLVSYAAVAFYTSTGDNAIVFFYRSW